MFICREERVAGAVGEERRRGEGDNPEGESVCEGLLHIVQFQEDLQLLLQPYVCLCGHRTRRGIWGGQSVLDPNGGLIYSGEQKPGNNKF